MSSDFTGTQRSGQASAPSVPFLDIGSAIRLCAGIRPLDQLQAIGTHLLQEFSKVITRYPEQCNMRLLRAMFPLLENGVADLSAVVQAGETT
jgi:hypothetical protein